MKIRTDFVTNSSSSSFLLEVAIDTVRGRVEFSDWGCDDEGVVLEVTASPRELALANNIDELVEMLRNRVFAGSPLKGGKFISDLKRKIRSMDDITGIGVTGNELNYEEYLRTYWYDRRSGGYYCDIEGDVLIIDGGSGGDLIFSDETLAVEKKYDEYDGELDESQMTPSNASYLNKELCDKFYNGQKKVIVSSSVKNLEYGSFSVWNFLNYENDGAMDQLEEVVLPSSVTSISPHCFMDLPALKRIIIKDNARYEVINNSIVEKDTATLIRYFGRDTGEYIMPSNIKRIASSAFSKATFDKIVLSESLETIERGAFCHSTISSVILPESLQIIDREAFADCKNLSSITFPGKIKNIEFNAFANCPKLEKAVIPQTITKMGKSVFARCKSLIIYGYENSYAHKYAQKNNYKFNVIQEDYSTANVLRGRSVTLTGFNETEKASLSEQIESVGGIIRSSVSTKTEILIYDSKYKGETVKLATAKQLINDGKKIIIWSDVEFRDILSGAKTVDVANELDAKTECLDERLIVTGVSEIKKGAYFKNTQIKTVEIGSDVQTIGENAFSGCAELETLVLNEGLKTIKAYAFRGCEKLRQIEIPASVRILEKGCFSGCHGLETIVLHEGLEEICEWAFAKCAIKEIKIPKSVIWLSYNVFDSCKKLELMEFSDKQLFLNRHYLLRYANQIVAENIVYEKSKYIDEKKHVYRIPEGVTKIKWPVDYYYSKFKELIIPEGITEILYDSLDSMTFVETITIPSTVCRISGDALRCDIKSIIYNGSRAQWNMIQFGRNYDGKPWDNRLKDYVIHCTDGDIRKTK